MSKAGDLSRKPSRHRPQSASWLALLWTLLTGGSFALAQQLADDPLPIVRMIVPADGLPAEFEKVRRGVLVQMPRADFETRVKRARQSLLDENQPARLTRSFYTATLNEQALVGKAGTWSFTHLGTKAIFPLPSLNLALHQLKWDQGIEAVLAEFDGKSQALLLDRTGAMTCTFDWSARGIPTQAGLHFDLHIPACPLTLFEFNLPTDAWLHLPTQAGGLLQGPLDTEKRDLKLWRLQVTGRSQVEFTVRRLGTDEIRLATQTTTRQVLTPDRVLTDFEFQIEPMKGAPRELIFEGDADLQPYEVTTKGNGISNWRWQPPSAKDSNSPGILTVKLQEPLLGTLSGFKIRCLTARLPDVAWISPALRLRQASARSETIELLIHPDLQLGKWEPGDFRLAQSATESDGGLTLTLVDPKHEAVPARRPSCIFRTQGTELRTSQKSLWHLEAGGMSLTSEITFDLARGSLHRLAVKLPPSNQRFLIESVELTPKDQLANWTSIGSLLLIDLQRGLTPRAPATLKVKLWAPDARFASQPRTLDFPDLEPQDISMRDGTFDIFADPVFQPRLLNTSARPISLDQPRIDPEQGVPSYSFSYRGQAVTGRLLLTPQSSRIRVQGTQEITLESRAGTWRTTLDLEPIVGHPEYLDLSLSAPLKGHLQVRVEGTPSLIRQVHHLADQEILPNLLSLGGGWPHELLLLQSQVPHSQRWRIQFAEPLQKKTRLVLEANLGSNPFESVSGRLVGFLVQPDIWGILSTVVVMEEASRADKSWAIPLVSVLDVERSEMETHIHASESMLTRARMIGLEQTHENRSTSTTGSDWTFRSINLTRESPHLSVWTRSQEAKQQAGAVVDGARLTTSVQWDGGVSQHVAFDLWNWRQPTFVIGFTSQVEILAVRVEGSWLNQLETTSVGGLVQVTLPVYGERDRQRIEILYQALPDRSSWPFTQNIASITPILPVPAMMWDRRWRLAPGLIPWQQEAIRRTTMPGGLAVALSPARTLRGAWHLGDETLHDLWHTLDPNRYAEQSQYVLGSEQTLRAQLDAKMTLGQALELLARQVLKEKAPLTLDREAFEVAGLHPLTPLGEIPAGQGATPFWEALGLVYIPCPHGSFMTTIQHRNLWLDRGVELDRIGTYLGPAVDGALRFGSDSTGTIVSLSHWLRHSRTTARTADTLLSPLRSDWTEWEYQPIEQVDALIVLDASAWRYTGWAFAGLLGVGVLIVRRFLAPIRWFRLQILLFALLVMTAIWVPMIVRDFILSPLLILAGLALIVSFATFVRSPATRGNARSTMIRTSSSSVGLLLLVLLPTLALSQPATPAPYVVLLLGEGTEQRSALVPSELLNKLDEIDQRSPTGSAGAVLTNARYAIRVKGATAQVEATFGVQALRDQADLFLPLTGIQLEEGVFLDATPVFPVAKKAGLLQPIREKGSHQLRLKFQVPISSAEFVELRFGIPRLLQTQVEVTWPNSVRDPQFVVIRGEEDVTGDGKGRATALKAQLGAEPMVQLRWLPDAPPSPGQTPEVHEAYFWDLRSASPSVIGELHYLFTRSAASQLNLHLPEGLEVRSIILTAPSAGGAAILPIRRWQIQGKDDARQLQIQLAQPMIGPVNCTLELIPRLSLIPGEVTLRLPTPLGAKTAGGVVAYSIEGLDANDRPQGLAVTALPSDQFSKLWATFTARELIPVTRAYSFRRTGLQASLGLGIQASRPLQEMECIWSIKPQIAELQAKLSLRSSSENLMLIEARVPSSLVLVDVIGLLVHHWTLQDSLLQVWLTHPCKQVSLEIVGWSTHGFDPNSSQQGRFTIPALQILSAQPGPVQIVLQPEKGIRVDADKVKQLIPGRVPLTYQAPGSGFEAAFKLQAIPTTSEASLLTSAQAHEGEIEFHALVSILASSEGPSLTIRVADWAGDDLRLISSVPFAKRTHTKKTGEHIWNLQLQKGLPNHFTLSLQGRVRVARADSFVLPRVSIDQVPVRERWLALSGLNRGDVEGQATNKPEPWRFGPLADRLMQKSSLWKLAQESRIQVRIPKRDSAAQARIVRAEQEAVCVAPDRWLHQGRYLVELQGATELHRVLPPQARWLSAAVDDRFVLPSKQMDGSWLIPLPEGRATCNLLVVWDYPQGGESVVQPHYRLAKVPGLKVDARVHLPIGCRRSLSRSSPLDTEALELLTEAQAALKRTEACLESEAHRGSLLESQRQFYAYLQHFESSLGWLTLHREPQTNRLKKQADELVKSNEALARNRHFEPIRLQAIGSFLTGHSPPYPFAPWLLTEPLTWANSDGEAVPPSLLLVAQQTRIDHRSSAELLLLITLALMLTTILRPGQTLLRFLWPEMVFIAGLIGIVVWGISLISIVLLTSSVILRGVWLVRRARILLQVVQQRFHSKST